MADPYIPSSPGTDSPAPKQDQKLHQEFLKRFQELETGQAKLQEQMKALVRQRDERRSESTELLVPGDRMEVSGGCFRGYFRKGPYWNILQSMGHALYICKASTGEITYWNRSAEDLYGWKDYEVLGQKVIDLLIGEREYMLVDKIMERLNIGQSWSGQFPFKKRSGEMFMAMVTESSMYEDGELTSVITVSSDASLYNNTKLGSFRTYQEDANQQPKEEGKSRRRIKWHPPPQIASSVSNLASKVFSRQQGGTSDTNESTNSEGRWIKEAERTQSEECEASASMFRLFAGRTIIERRSKEDLLECVQPAKIAAKVLSKLNIGAGSNGVSGTDKSNHPYSTEIPARNSLERPAKPSSKPIPTEHYTSFNGNDNFEFNKQNIEEANHSKLVHTKLTKLKSREISGSAPIDGCQPQFSCHHNTDSSHISNNAVENAANSPRRIRYAYSTSDNRLMDSDERGTSPNRDTPNPSDEVPYSDNKKLGSPGLGCDECSGKQRMKILLPGQDSEQEGNMYISAEVTPPRLPEVILSPKSNSGESDGASSHANPSNRGKVDSGSLADYEIRWEDLHLGGEIGQGSCAVVYRGMWNESDVAIKVYKESEYHEDILLDYKKEIAIMKKLRHPNVLLFMGAVYSPDRLAIVTEFLPRGSLFRTLHRNNRTLDLRRRLKMALDVARGMNYLHRRNPPIVHRDLKSSNLLVDKNWTVKVGDFGLSRLKSSSFLTAKSGRGTPQWMAPEVLRNEPLNEKSDVFSFGVILWELMTQSVPWSNLSSLQVVEVVGFMDRRLELPVDLDPRVSSVIQDCWISNPESRPSFEQILQRMPTLINAVAPAPIARRNLENSN